MRRKKVRGHNRIHRKIENWRKYGISMNLENALNGVSERAYMKIQVHPYSGISVVNSSIPEASGTTKRLILQALIDIYDAWKIQLDNLGKPYYLKIWLFEPRFSKSQVVCSTGKDHDFYLSTFYKPEIEKRPDLHSYGNLKTRLESFNWEYHLDEEYEFDIRPESEEMFSSLEEYKRSQKWLNKELGKPHRVFKFNSPEGEKESYAFRKGVVWIGSRF